MSAIQQLANAAGNNHGISLQPAQVHEVMETLANYNNAYTGTAQRLESLTYMAQVMLERLGGKVKLTALELDEAAAGNGFDVEWDEVSDVITIRLSEVAVPEVPAHGEPTEDGGPSLALVPEPDSSVAEDGAEDS